MDNGKLESRLDSLLETHKKLDENIKRGYTNYMDDAGLAKIKQEKAHVRRQIEKIKEKLNLINV
jgi:hypothetical protein